MNWELLLRLLTAHFLGDFVFQTRSLADGKEKNGLKSRHLYVHVLIIAVVTGIMVWNTALWPLVLFIVLSHLAVDAAKKFIHYHESTVFIADQLVHLAVILGAWLYFTHQSGEFIRLVVSFAHKPATWGVVLAYIVLTQPASVLITIVTSRWRGQINSSNGDSLEDAGKWIGILERVMTLTAILSNHWGIVGFLLGAKSVFRFGDLHNSRDRKMTEYIIIGTLLSFSIAIFTGLLLNLLKV